MLAPQANVMATVVNGIMNGNLPWAPIMVGAMLALAIELLDLLENAWEQMLQRVERTSPAATIEGILVERMSLPGIEMILGGRRDPDWGPILMLGLGGIWTEALEDVRLIPAGSSVAEIIAELRRLKAAKVLDGLRGSPPADVAALAATAARLGALMLASPEIEEIEINPLNVYPRGQGIVALDALMQIR